MKSEQMEQYNETSPSFFSLETPLFKRGLSQKAIKSRSIPQVGRELTKESRKIRGFFGWDINFKVAKTHSYRYIHFLHLCHC